MNAQVNPNNEKTTYFFEYSSSEAEVLASKGTKVPITPPAALENFGFQGASAPTGVLHADKTYYYRVVAENAQSVKEDKPVEGAVEHFQTAPETPEGLKAEPITTSTAKLNGVLNPKATEAGDPETYEFVYRQAIAGCQGAGEAALPEGAAGGVAEAVKAELSGLPPGETYTFCLRVRSEAGVEALSVPVTFTTLAVAPTIEAGSEFVSEVASSSATLHASIDPGGASTGYRVQYVSEAQFDAHGFAEASEAPEPEASAGTGHGVVAGLVHVQGLTASIVYRYRFVAGNAVQRGVQGEDGTFTTQPSGTEFSLPDGRAWELVSPPDKHGGSIDPLTTYGGAIQAAENGGAFTYVTTDPIDGEPPGNRGGLEPSQELATRGTDGWSNEDITSPNSCTGPLQTSVEADSWQEPSNVLSYGPSVAMPALDGCNKLPFSSSISVAPDGQAASTPTGLTVGIHVPQESTLEGGGGLAESAVKETVVALPEGVQVSPAAADELLACSDAQVGFTGVEPGSGRDLFTPAAVECPDASKIGTVEIKTPFLAEPLEGGVYLATQDENPFGSLIAMYVYAENAKEGVAVKLPGEVELNPVTGQLVTVFPNNPQVSFEEAKLHFFGSDRAPLSTPPACGAYTTTASITPWSGNAPSNSSSTFDITSGPDETPCASPRPFQPGFQAGTTSVQAGGYSPLTMTMTRPDADQQLGKLSVVFPPGVSAGLRGVKLCEEPQAATGECPAESQIGQVTASAGLGGDPYSVETGKAYITGPYEGDPFGVDVVVPAIAGPFNLGTEVVRSKVDVDPTDAHLTVVSDKFPTILDGIPLQLQHINVTVNRPGFVFNPTSCEPMKLTGELESIEGATADVATPFQVTNCAALSFKPEFAVSTSAKTSRTEGASLHVSLTLPAGAQGTKANVAKVKVSLPKQLPSPLKTLQKACTEKVFAENPSNCPKASRVGEAKVETPVLEGPLTGPAYFVSHGGAKYPELIIVLTGEDGVTVQVHGETFISKAGITTATFSTVPDVPFSNFELELPQREYPALTANGDLCKGTLIMPTEMVGQNGLKINQETKISVTGCPKIKKSTHKKRGKAKKKRKKA